MHNFLLRYRIKLSCDILTQNTIYGFFNGDYTEKECDYEIMDIYGNIYRPFSNSSLDSKNCFENSLIIIHDTPVAAQDALKGDFEYFCDSYFQSYHIWPYIIYENAEADTLYIVKQNFSFLSSIDSDLPSLMQTFMDICQKVYGIEDLSYEIKSQVISEDGKVAKVKLVDFYQLKENKDELAFKLNRIFPS